MSSTKSVLITTLKPTLNREELQYFQMKDMQDELSFCTGISIAEPGAKNVLCFEPVDEILVIINVKALKDQSLESVELKNYRIPEGKTVGDLTDFEFFCYRMSQYMNHKNFELKQKVNGISEEEKAELRRRLQTALGCEQEDCFYTAVQRLNSGNAPAEVTDNMIENQDKISALAYADMDSYYKTHPMKINESVTARLFPVEKDRNGYVSVTNMLSMFHELVQDKDNRLQLHIDLQGMGGTDSHALWNVISLAANSSENIELKSMISTYCDEGEPISTVRNEILSYDTERLLSGMRAFVNYGKVDILEDFVNDHEIESKTFRKYIAAMKYVDAGLSLCSVNDLEFGINYLRDLFASDDGHDDKETGTTEPQRALLELLKDGIKNDFGELLSGEELSLPCLIDWAFRNQYYQQALTLVESQIPMDIVKRGMFYYAKTEEDIEECLRLWNIEYWSTVPRLRYIFNFPDHFFVKNHGYNLVDTTSNKEKNVRDFCRIHIGQIHGEYPELGPAYSELDDDELLFNVMASYGDLSNIRNIISHATGELTLKEESEDFIANENLILVTKKLDQFLRLYFKACEKLEANGKNGQSPLIISPQRFKSYTYKNRMQTFKEDEETGQLKGDYKVNYNGEEVTVSIKLKEARKNEN